MGELCQSLGASSDDLVPFSKYANAARNLPRPSSAARALSAGAKNIERVDKIVQLIGKSKGVQLDELDQIVQRVDAWLEKNRSAAN